MDVLTTKVFETLKKLNGRVNRISSLEEIEALSILISIQTNITTHFAETHHYHNSTIYFLTSNLLTLLNTVITQTSETKPDLQLFCIATNLGLMEAVNKVKTKSHGMINEVYRMW